MMNVTAFEALLIAADSDDKKRINSEHVEILCNLLAIPQETYEQLKRLLFPPHLQGLSLSAFMCSQPVYRALVLIETRVNGLGNGNAPLVAAFQKRQRDLISASITANRSILSVEPHTPGKPRTPATPTVAEEPLLEGWLEKRAARHLLKPWLPRYVRLFRGRLEWSHENDGRKERTMPLNSRALVVMESATTMRVVCDERVVTFRSRSLERSGVGPVDVLDPTTVAAFAQQHAPSRRQSGSQLVPISMWTSKVEEAAAAAAEEELSEPSSAHMQQLTRSLETLLDERMADNLSELRAVQERLLSLMQSGAGQKHTVEEGTLLRWPPDVAYQMYVHLISAANTEPRAGVRMELLAALRHIQTPLRISSRAHALAVLHVCAESFSVAANDASDDRPTLIDSLHEALSAALWEQVAHMRIEQELRNKRAAASTALRLRLAARRGAQSKRDRQSAPPRMLALGRRSIFSVISRRNTTAVAPPIEPTASAEEAATVLIQLAVRRNLLTLRRRRLELEYPSAWESANLIATVGRVASTLEAYLAKLGISPSEELGPTVGVWRTSSLATHVAHCLQSPVSAHHVATALETVLLRLHGNAGCAQAAAHVSPGVQAVIAAADGALEVQTLSLITVGAGVHVRKLQLYVREEHEKRLAHAGRQRAGRCAPKDAVALEGWFEKLPSKWGEQVRDNDGNAFDGVGALIDAISWRRRYVRLLPGRLTYGVDPTDTKARTMMLGADVFATISVEGVLRICASERSIYLRLSAEDKGTDGNTSTGASSVLHTWAAQVEQVALGAQIETEGSVLNAAVIWDVAMLLVSEVDGGSLVAMDVFAPCAGGGARGKSKSLRAALIAAANALIDEDARALLKGFENVGMTVTQTLSKLGMLRLTMEVADDDMAAEADAELEAIQQQRLTATATVSGTRTTTLASAALTLDSLDTDRVGELPQLMPELNQACMRVLQGFCAGVEEKLARAIDRMLLQEKWSALHQSVPVTNSVVDLLQLISEVVGVFSDVLSFGGDAGEGRTASVRQLLDAIDKSLIKYWNQLRCEWQRGEASLPRTGVAWDSGNRMHSCSNSITDGSFIGAPAKPSPSGQDVDLVKSPSEVDAKPSSVVVLLREGWLEKANEKAWPRHWNRRYVRVLPSRLSWAHDQVGTRAHDVKLDANTIVTIEEGVLRVRCEERIISLRLPRIKSNRPGETPTHLSDNGLLREWSVYIRSASSAATDGSMGELPVRPTERQASTVETESAALLLQAHARARIARRNNPLTISQLCAILNNYYWARKQAAGPHRRVDLIVREMRRKFELRPEIGLQLCSAKSESAALDLVGNIIRRCVYHLMLPQLAGCRNGLLSPLIRRLNELCKLCISNARPPWRLPLLCGLLGTATNAIEEVRKSEEHFFSHTVQAAPVFCLHLTDDFGSSEDAPAERFQASLQDVQQAFGADTITLEADIQNVLEADLRPDAIGGLHYVRQLEHWAEQGIRISDVS